jgi:chromosomal replication initiation ATPase DnaA
VALRGTVFLKGRQKRSAGGKFNLMTPGEGAMIMIIEFSARTGISVEDLLGRRRFQQIVEARQLYWYILSLNGFRITEIARLNEREHGSIISGIRRIKGFLDTKDFTVTKMYYLTKDIKR